MFAVIETNGATQILIHVPSDAAAKSLPTLAGMLENNAVFVKSGWRDSTIVKPDMSITLGDAFSVKDSETAEILIQASECVVDDNFVIATPAVLTSNKALTDKMRTENERLQKELSYKTSELTRLQERIVVLTAAQEEC